MTIRAEIDFFLARTGMAATRFGVEIAGSKGLVANIRAGHEPRPARVAQIRRFMADYQAPEPAPPKPREVKIKVGGDIADAARVEGKPLTVFAAELAAMGLECWRDDRGLPVA